MNTTTADELADALERVTAATRELRSSDHVPPSVAQVVDGLAVSLHADAPLRLEVDPYLSTRLFAAALRATQALREGSPAEQRRDLRVALEQVRHALRDIAEGAPFAADVPARQVLATLADTLNVPQRELADLLEVSTRQLQRWLAADGPSPGGDDEARIRAVAQIVNHLRHVFTPPGVLAWFRRPHPRLDRPPVELLKDPASFPQLRDLAASARSMAG